MIDRDQWEKIGKAEANGDNLFNLGTEILIKKGSTYISHVGPCLVIPLIRSHESILLATSGFSTFDSF